MKAEAQKEQSGQTTTTWMGKDVIQTVWNGRIDAPTMENLLVDLKRTLGTQRATYWYSNTAGVTNYAVDIRKPSIELLNYLKQQGCEEIVGIVNSPAIRMLSMSLSFVVGLRVKVFANEEEATRYLETQGQGARTNMQTKSQMLIDRVDNAVVTCSVGAFSVDDLVPLANALSADDVSVYIAGAAGDVDLDPKGRDLLFSLLRKRGIKVLAVSDSKAAKGIVTAATWMGVSVLTRSWTDLGEEAGAETEMLGPRTRELLLRQKQECQLHSLRLASQKPPQ